MYSCVLCCLESLAYCVNNYVIHTLQLTNHLTSGPAEHFGGGWYSCDKITMTQIQISHRNLNGFFSNISNQMMI
jgi:uncharacterized membrane protein YbjE (DUF340 family)